MTFRIFLVGGERIKGVVEVEVGVEICGGAGTATAVAGAVSLTLRVGEE